MQFSLRTLLWLTVGAAISVASVVFASKRIWDTEILVSMRYFGVRSAQNCPLFVPLVIAAYAIGRRRLNGYTIIALVIVEAMAFAVQAWAMSCAEYLQTL